MSKKFLPVVLSALFSFTSLFAQMTDDQIVDYVQTQTAQGLSQEDIAKQLVKRGVSLTQLRSIKAKYDQMQKNGMIANTLPDENNRSRTSASYTNGKKDRNAKTQLNIVQTQADAEAERLLSGDDRIALYMEESSFLFTDSIAMLEQMILERERQKKEIFGHSIFSQKDLTFEPSTSIATPQDYRLGAGDEIIIDIWGEAQSTVNGIISPDGTVIVENFGPLHLAGKTISEAKEYVQTQLSKIYKGVGGTSPSTFISFSLGQNRSIQVNVMGEVENPGTYILSSFATVFNALYMAGGVNDIGSLRSIKVFRNNKQVAVLDVYDYLLNGKIDSDIRLTDNDVIVVSPYSVLVNASGRLRRPMFYELKPTESAATLISYAGGLSADAYKGDVRVIRFGDVQRQIFTLDAEQQKSFNMCDGDTLIVDSILQTFSNKVEVQGAVYRPGMFQVGNGVNTVKQLVEAAGGVREDAFRNRSILSRRNADLTLSSKSLDLDAILSGTAPDVELRNNDILFIPTVQELKDEPTMSIYGDVRFPGTYKYADSTQIEDLIIQAGGFKESASISNVEIVRYSRDKRAKAESHNIAKVFTFQVDENLKVQDTVFYLMPFDNVNILRSPGYTEASHVEVSGEVLFPGTYTLLSRGDRVSDLLKRVGDCTSYANIDGISLERRMTDQEKSRLRQITETLSKNDSAVMAILDKSNTYHVGFDISNALNNYDSEDNIVLRDGDRIVVPTFQNTVKINGNVMYPNTLSYIPGKNLRFYINRAGGFGTRAKRSRVYVVYANGSVNRVKLSNSNKLKPGCEIVVPTRDEHERMSAAEILSLSSTSASLATVVISLLNLFR